MKTLLIGEAPSKNEPNPRPLEGRVGRRLADYAGISFEDYLERFDRTNLLQVRQDTKEHGFAFNRTEGHLSAIRLQNAFKPGQTVVLLGKRVADCFGAISKGYFEPYRLQNDVTLFVVPHPSGINRWHNSEENREQMRTFMHMLKEIK